MVKKMFLGSRKAISQVVAGFIIFMLILTVLAIFIPILYWELQLRQAQMRAEQLLFQKSQEQIRVSADADTVCFRNIGEKAVTIKYVIYDPSGLTNQNWLSGWQYRKSHTILGSTEVSNYQMKIVVHYGNGTDDGENVYLHNNSRTDFGDVRFTADDGVTELSYWVEEKVDTDYAVFWVKVPQILENATIYIYYGNPSATTTSDGKSTFPVFYDFNIDESGDWILEAGSWYWDTQNGWLRTEGGSKTLALVQDKTMSVGQAIRVRVKWDPEKPFAGNCFAYQDSANYYTHRLSTYPGYEHSFYRFSQSLGNGYVFAESYDTSPQTWYILETRWVNATYVICVIDNYTKIVTSGLVSSWTSGKVGIRSYHYGAGDYVYYDWFLVRNCVDPEPSHGAWGEEETPSSSIQAVNVILHPGEVYAVDLVGGYTGIVTSLGNYYEYRREEP